MKSVHVFSRSRRKSSECRIERILKRIERLNQSVFIVFQQNIYVCLYAEIEVFLTDLKTISIKKKKTRERERERKRLAKRTQKKRKTLSKKRALEKS